MNTKSNIKFNNMENQIKIIVPISDCERTGLPRVARYTNHSVHANRSVSVSYAIDTLDLNGEVYLKGSEQGEITHHSQAIHRGTEVIEPVEMSAEIQALLDAEKPLLTNILNTLNTTEEEE